MVNGGRASAARGARCLCLAHFAGAQARPAEAGGKGGLASFVVFFWFEENGFVFVCVFLF